VLEEEDGVDGVEGRPFNGCNTSGYTEERKRKRVRNEREING
jgi:hypothetical protein